MPHGWLIPGVRSEEGELVSASSCGIGWCIGGVWLGRFIIGVDAEISDCLGRKSGEEKILAPCPLRGELVAPFPSRTHSS